MPLFANAILPKARALYGRRISKLQYSELLRKQSVQEISAFLREKTSYAHALAGVQDSTIHRGQLEELLHKDLLYQFSRMAHFVPTKERIYTFIIMEAEIKALLDCVTHLHLKKDHKESDLIAVLPAFLRPYAAFDLYALAGVRDYMQLASVVEHCLYGPVVAKLARRAMEEPVSLGEWEAALRILYFTTLLDSADHFTKGRTRADLRKVLLIRAEMRNINTIYRMKAYFNRPAEVIRPLLLPFSAAIQPALLDQLLEAPSAQEMMKLLAAKSPYRRMINPEDEFVEGQTDRIRMTAYGKLLHFSTSPEAVYTAFMLLREMEIENVTRIVEGVRYHVEPEKIESLLYPI